jgi:hypothetical protein
MAVAAVCLADASGVAADTIYRLERKGDEPVLVVQVDRAAAAAETELVLRGAEWGVMPQVRAPSCDGEPLAEVRTGQWRVPAGCRSATWEVPLDRSGTAPASGQRSLIMGSGVLFSEGASLPRLKDADPVEALRIETGAQALFPAPAGGVLRLPGRSEAPLLVLIGVEPVARRAEQGTELVYFADDPGAIGRLPDIDAHLRGLMWLKERIPSATGRFAVAWLGVSRDLFTIGGAAGRGLQLVNYFKAGEPDRGTAISLYIALHEAVHQLAALTRSRPGWAEESLASYVGAKALLAATNDAPDARAVVERFESDASAVKEGLLAIDRHMSQSGERSGTGAFYTKGLAFWAAVDEALRAEGQGGLDTRLAMLFTTDYEEGALDGLGRALGLSADVWGQLRRRYLD